MINRLLLLLFIENDISWYRRPEFTQDINGIPRPMKERKKHDRFNGMPEEEVSKRTLPDHLTSNLDIIIVSTERTCLFAYRLCDLVKCFQLSISKKETYYQLVIDFAISFGVYWSRVR